MVMRPRDRIDYSAMADRAPLKLPDGKRVAVWVIVNIENWDVEKFRVEGENLVFSDHQKISMYGWQQFYLCSLLNREKSHSMIG